jgi:putative ATP-binding cassette transporter
MQVVNAFSYVQNSLSFFINVYPEIATLQAVTQRLSGFEERLLAIHQLIPAQRQTVIRRSDVRVAVEGVDLDLPDGTTLLRGVSFESDGGEAVLITGPSGAGNSTLLRAMGRTLAFWPRRNQARRRANPLRAATALSATRHSRQRAALPIRR